jgi:hypothetical protein
MPAKKTDPTKKVAAAKASTTKTSASAKKSTVKTAAKAAAVKKVAKGDSYVCGVCGLAVTVDDACGCVDVCDIICCGEPMKTRKVPVKAKAAK